MRRLLPADFFSLFSDSLVIGAFTILMIAFNGVVRITAQPHMISMCATGETERAGHVGQTYGSIVKRLVTIGWALTGLIVAAMIIKSGEHLQDPEIAFGFASRVLLAPGLTGLMIASVLAANMSSASNFMVNTRALFTQNFHKEFINKNPTDKQLLWTGRYSCFALTLLGVTFVIYVDKVLHAFLFIETISAFMGIMIFSGILWKGANRFGALGGVVIAFVVYYYLNYLNTDKLDLVYQWTPDTFGWAMLAGFAGFILISLLTPKDDDKTEKFFDNMRRLSDENVSLNNAEKPYASKYGKDLILVDLSGWFSKERRANFIMRYKEDIYGFILATGFVGVLILIA